MTLQVNNTLGHGSWGAWVDMRGTGHRMEKAGVLRLLK